MSDAIVLSARSVSKSYGGAPAVREASLDLRSGRITCLLGPSGCGKSTLLRLLAGLEPLDGGEIEAAGRLLSAPGRTVPPEGRGVGLVFQDFALFPHLNAAQNVAFGLSGLAAREKVARARALLGQFRLADRAEAWPHTLSGGEQQRVAIARALAREPQAILLDEPFSGLDGDLKAEVRHAVLSGLREAKAGVLIVTHDPEEALLMGDELALMAGGRILQCGPPRDCYLRPATLAAARLLGEANVLPARVADGRAVTPFGDMPAAGQGEGAALVMVRPEGLCLDPAGREVEAVRVRFGGAFHEVTLLSDGTEATLRLAGGPAPEKGPVRVRIDPERACIFPENAA
ncbi:MAG: ABC transporter ATP-binding protein [Allosphingosinicella sp.]|uniref:ABC transporter ATP-binding protein n=1 Tax=Allosphingosinicella sp. TaxID=2823234 RepID=UPI00392050D7